MQWRGLPQYYSPSGRRPHDRHQLRPLVPAARRHFQDQPRARTVELVLARGVLDQRPFHRLEAPRERAVGRVYLRVEADDLPDVLRRAREELLLVRATLMRGRSGPHDDARQRSIDARLPRPGGGYALPVLHLARLLA